MDSNLNTPPEDFSATGDYSLDEKSVTLMLESIIASAAAATMTPQAATTLTLLDSQGIENTEPLQHSFSEPTIWSHTPELFAWEVRALPLEENVELAPLNKNTTEIIFMEGASKNLLPEENLVISARKVIFFLKLK